jgi:hypothetical protein
MSTELQDVKERDVFFPYIFLANQRFISCNILLCRPSQRSACSQSAIKGGNLPGDLQSAVGWGDAGFKPGTAGRQSGAQY